MFCQREGQVSINYRLGLVVVRIDPDPQSIRNFDENCQSLNSISKWKSKITAPSNWNCRSSRTAIGAR